MKKIILPLLLAIIFSCGQALAASIDDGEDAVPMPVYDKSRHDFGTEFNDVAKKLGNFTITRDWQLMSSKEDVEGYMAHASTTDDINVGIAQLKGSDNIRNVFVVTNNEKDAQQAIQTICHVLGLTNDEINSRPIFVEESTYYNFWCEAAKRTIIVSTARTQSVYVTNFEATSK